uniref:Uncharacterized protein n=1 Tax=Guillardia theta (strain CCMP2712) TaxID=905079 RepID=A0A0C3TZS3_GUITC
MHMAAWAGHADVVRKLLEVGADPNAHAMDDMTCLHFACQKGSVACISILIEHQADLEALDRKKKNTPLHMACEKGHIEIVKLLVEAGSNLKAKNKFHKTPFDASANEETRMALPGGFSKV